MLRIGIKTSNFFLPVNIYINIRTWLAKSKKKKHNLKTYEDEGSIQQTSQHSTENGEQDDSERVVRASWLGENRKHHSAAAQGSCSFSSG